MSPWNKSYKRFQRCDLRLHPLDDRLLPTVLGLLPVSLVESALPTAQVVSTEPVAASPIAIVEPVLSAASVKVVEVALAPDTVFGEVTSNTPELPNRIVEALDGAFPGWTQAERDAGTNMGVTEYAVNADWNGVPVELRLTENGQIRELAQDLSPSKLPKPFKDWVGENFPGGVTNKVARVIDPKGVSYDLLIVTAAGRKIEATLRYDRTNMHPVVEASSDVEKGEKTSADDLVPDPTVSWIQAAASNGVSDSQTAGTTTSGSQANFGSSSAGVAHPQARIGGRGLFGVEDAVPQPGIALAAEEPPTNPVEGSSAVVRDLMVALSEAGPAALLMPIAGTLYDQLPIDAEAVERGLHQFVDGLDSLAENLSSDVGVQGITSWGAMIAAFLAGSWASRRHWRQTRLAPMLKSTSVSNTWSWIVGGPAYPLGSLSDEHRFTGRAA